MSDDLQAFLAKTDAMINLAKHQVGEIGKRFVLTLAWEVIDTTPGPNLQLPETEYIATGRLRAAWTASTVRVSYANRWDGGPYTEHGDDTLAAIEGFLAGAQAPPPHVYLNNDVAYGYIVWHGIGRMPVARPWTGIVATPTNVAAAAQAARLEVMGR